MTGRGRNRNGQSIPYVRLRRNEPYPWSSCIRSTQLGTLIAGTTQSHVASPPATFGCYPRMYPTERRTWEMRF